MKILETNTAWPAWLVGLCNWLAIDGDSVRSIGFARGFKENGEWKSEWRRTGNEALFYNAKIFVRFSFPFGIFWGIRWSDDPESKRQFWQAGFGWKLNGRPGTLCRVSSDKAAAKGTTGPNFNQAQGFEYGPH